MSLDTQSLLTLQTAQTQVDTQNQAKFQAMAKASTAAARGQGTDHIAKLGLDFESMCLSSLLKPMFEGLKTDGPFGGGQGEEAMKSFYIDAIAKQMARHGGIGISDMMQKQLLKLQEAG
jgi:Rod binding domain-containing protein